MTTKLNGLRPSLVIMDDLLVPPVKNIKKTTNYSQLNPNDIPKYASLIADEISNPMLIKFDHDFDYLLQYAITDLRKQTASDYRNDIFFNYRTSLFFHYLQHSNLAKDSPLYTAVGDELKKRRFYQLL